MDDVLRTMRISAAGMRTQGTRLRVISENVANADSLPTGPGASWWSSRVGADGIPRRPQRSRAATRRPMPLPRSTRPPSTHGRILPHVTTQPRGPAASTRSPKDGPCCC